MSALEYFEPETVEAALELLGGREDARCLAGGQTLVAMMNAGLIDSGCLVSLGRVQSLGHISVEPSGALLIGAMVTHARIALEPRLEGALSVVREAASVTAHPAVRNLGTIGGTICHADASADYPAAIVAAEAEVEIAGLAGRRTVPAEQFFLDYLTTALEQGEMVTGVRFPKSSAGAVGVYEKFGRVDGDFAIISVALVLELQGSSVLRARIALGGCSSTPVRVRQAEQILESGGLGPRAIEAASGQLLLACNPTDDVRATAGYRGELIPRILTRAVNRAVARGVH
jgi:carbon-monoxide dehydrogenase medium subunit